MSTIDTTATFATAAQANASKPRDTGSSVMGKEDFLRLLVTQLSNQDPLNPMDGQQFAAQLAQFSSVEQLLNINEAMTSQSEMTGLLSQNINNGVATGLIGRKIVASSDQIGLAQSGGAPVGFEFERAVDNASITITDAAGKVVRTLDLGSMTAGTHEIQWDGTGTNGSRMPEGTYTIEVKGTDTEGETVTASPLVKGTVDRVSFGANGILLWMGGTSVGLSAVQSVEQPSTP